MVVFKGAILVLFLSLFVTDAFCQLSIDNLPASAPVAQYETEQKCLFKLEVTDHVNSTGFTCQLSPLDSNFRVFKAPDDKYCVHFITGPLSGASVDVNVRCENSIPETVTGTFTVNIVPNEPPQVTSPESLTVDAMTTAINTPLKTLTVTDKDGDTLKYTLTSPLNYFTVETTDGSIRAVKDLKAITSTRETLMVEVTDSRTPPVPIEVVITITNLNTEPTISNIPLAAVTVKETAAVDSLVYKCTGADTTSTGSPLIYTGSISPSGQFSFDATDCTIKVSGALSDETQKTYSAVITVSDGYLTKSYTVPIEVEHVPSTIDITNLPTTTSVKEKQDTDLCLLPLVISESSGQGYNCYLEPTHAQFIITKRPGDTEYCLYFKRTGSPLADVQYSLTAACENDEKIKDTRTVTVDVTKNNPPTVSSKYSGTVDVATATPGATIYTLTATDQDGDALTYSLVSSVPGFSIDSNNGNIITSNDLRLSDNRTVVMNIKVSDGSPTADVTTELTLTMTNFNSKPVITNTQEVSVPENTPSGSDIFKCITQDTTVYDKLTYSAVFTPATATTILEFDTATCAVTIKDGQQFDFETLSSYSIKITVNDGFKSDEFTIPITILDENDPPKFTRRTYPENAQEGDIGTITIIPPFEASDPENDPKSYEIVNSSQPGLFSVQNGLTGEISNNVAIDYETLTAADNPISLIVRVRDATSGEDTATVLVRITDKNDEKPEFASSSNSFNISTSTAVSSKLLTVKATDKDSPPNAKITYSLKSESPDATGHFNVLDNGDVLLNTAVTAPYNSNFRAEILATDQGGLSSTIIIEGVWNKAPKILGLPATAATSKDQTTSKDVFTFETEDVENDEVTCSIQSVVPTTPTLDQTKLTNAFTISGSATAGEFNVRYRGSSFYELDGEQFEINLECADGNGGSDTGKLELEVAPNKQPTAACSPTASITISALNNAVDAVVYDLLINDPENDPLQIQFNSYPDNGFYRFDSATGTVKVKNDLRLESTESYQWNLTIIDGNHKVIDGSKTVFVPVQCYIDVTVSDLNVAPRFVKESNTIALPEDTEPGTLLHTFDVTDGENTSISCDTTPQTEDALFVKDEKAKTITLAPGKSFDFEGPYKLYSFICVATDGYLSATGSLTISITDTNDKPYFAKPIYTVTVDEGQVGAVKAKPDFQYDDEEKATQTYTYSLNYTEEDASFFDINPTTGEITNIKEIDVDAAAAKTMLSFTVTITDSLGGFGTTQLDINLRDINDFTPELDPTVYEYELYELRTVGQAINEKGNNAVAATDEDKEDINKNIVYSLDSANEFFDMSPTGELRLLKSLKGHYNTRFNLKVKATDTGINPGPRSSTAPIIFTWNQPLEIAGLDDVGKWKEDDIVVGKVPGSDIALTDADTTDNALLECVTDSINPNTEAFEVRKESDANYAVYYNGREKLDYRSISRYTVTVRCIDRYGGGSVVKSYNIDVEKNKDPVPSCHPSATLSPDAKTLTKAGEVINTISVTDVDSTSFTYNLVSSPPNGATPAFRVGRFDGKIETTMNLGFVDREPVRELLVEIADNHQNSVTCTIVVNIENMNEPPKFVNLPTTKDVEETAKIDAEILTVTLTDDVCGDPIDLTWTVQPSGNRDFFTVEIPDTGKVATVKVAKELDHETEPTQYRFTFRAKDGCLAEDSQVLTVNVKDVNEPPTFSKGDKYFANVSEVETGIIDLDCRGIDPDQGDELTLELKGPQAKYFKVTDAAKCQIQLVGEYPLDKPDNVDGKNIELEMILKDKAGSGTPADDPTSTATATATINIWDYNDNIPLFDQAAYTGTDIVAGDQVGKVLGTVAATDKDFEEKTNGRIEYYLQSCTNGGDPYIGVLGDGTIELKQDISASGIPYGTIFSCSIEARDKGIYPGTLSSTTRFDVVYQEPPPVVNTIIVPVTPDPNAGNNGGTDTGAGAAAGAGAGASANAGASSNSEDFLNSPAAIAVLSVLGVVLGAALLALLLFLCCRFCLGNCGGGGSGMCCNNGSDIAGGDYYSTRPGSTVSTSHIKVNEGSGGYNSVRPSPVMHP